MKAGRILLYGVGGLLAMAVVALGAGAGGSIGKAAGGITDTVKKGSGGVGDAVRGLFKR